MKYDLRILHHYRALIWIHLFLGHDFSFDVVLNTWCHIVVEMLFSCVFLDVTTCIKILQQLLASIIIGQVTFDDEIFLLWLDICRWMRHHLWGYLSTIGKSVLVVWVCLCHDCWLCCWPKTLLLSCIGASTSISLFEKDHLLLIQLLLLLLLVVKTALGLIHFDKFYWRIWLSLTIRKGQLFSNYKLRLPLKPILCLYLLLVLLILYNHLLFSASIDMGCEWWLLIAELLILLLLLRCARDITFVCCWCGWSWSLLVILRVKITDILSFLILRGRKVELLLFLLYSPLIFNFLNLFEIRTAHHDCLVFILWLLRDLLILFHVLFNFFPRQVFSWSCRMVA